MSTIQPTHTYNVGARQFEEMPRKFADILSDPEVSPALKKEMTSLLYSSGPHDVILWKVHEAMSRHLPQDSRYLPCNPRLAQTMVQGAVKAAQDRYQGNPCVEDRASLIGYGWGGFKRDALGPYTLRHLQNLPDADRKMIDQSCRTHAETVAMIHYLSFRALSADGRAPLEVTGHFGRVTREAMVINSMRRFWPGLSSGTPYSIFRFRTPVCEMAFYNLTDEPVEPPVPDRTGTAVAMPQQNIIQGFTGDTEVVVLSNKESSKKYPGRTVFDLLSVDLGKGKMDRYLLYSRKNASGPFDSPEDEKWTKEQAYPEFPIIIGSAFYPLYSDTPLGGWNKKEAAEFIANGVQVFEDDDGNTMARIDLAKAAGKVGHLFNATNALYFEETRATHAILYGNMCQMEIVEPVFFVPVEGRVYFVRTIPTQFTDEMAKYRRDEFTYQDAIDCTVQFSEKEAVVVRGKEMASTTATAPVPPVRRFHLVENSKVKRVFLQRLQSGELQVRPRRPITSFKLSDSEFLRVRKKMIHAEPYLRQFHYTPFSGTELDSVKCEIDGGGNIVTFRNVVGCTGSTILRINNQFVNADRRYFLNGCMCFAMPAFDSVIYQDRPRNVHQNLQPLIGMHKEPRLKQGDSLADRVAAIAASSPLLSPLANIVGRYLDGYPELVPSSL